jgi:hypothetical protein
MNELEQLLSEARAATESPSLPLSALRSIERAISALPSAAASWAGAGLPHPAAVVGGMKLGASGWLLTTIAVGTVGAMAVGGFTSGRPSPAPQARQEQTVVAPATQTKHLSMRAEPTVVAQPQPSAPKVVYRHTTVIDFTSQSLFGETERPSMEAIFSPPKATFPTLVRVRKNFQDELVRSADNL